MLERYSTERLAPTQKIRRWCDFGSSTLSRLAVRPYQPNEFHAQMVRATLGSIGITHMTSSPAVAEGMDDSVGEWASSDDGALAITYYKAGRPRLMQGGRTLQFAPGDVVIRDLRRQWQQDSGEDFALMTVKIPSRCFGGAFEFLQSHVMVPLRAGDPRASLLSSLIENLGRMAFDDSVTPGSQSVERLLSSAVEIAFSPGPIQRRADHQGLPPAIAHYLESHLHDPDLSVAGLAHDLGLNIRGVQRAFHQAGTSPKAYILARRLAEAAEQLHRAASTGRVNITDIALSLGFNDPGYFSRVFHEEYGVTPTQFLQRHRYIL
jgi:AraC family transcriptional regulator, positive regulator of tynA and feaB